MRHTHTHTHTHTHSLSISNVISLARAQVKVLERMTLELFAMAEPHVLIPGTGGVLCSMSAAVNDMVAYTKLTDAVLLLIEVSADPALAPAQELLASIRRRELYKFVGKAQPGPEGDPAQLSRSHLPAIRTAIARRLPKSSSAVGGLGVTENDIVLDLIHISHGCGVACARIAPLPCSARCHVEPKLAISESPSQPVALSTHRVTAAAHVAFERGQCMLLYTNPVAGIESRC
jgi:hypothetical protein